MKRWQGPAWAALGAGILALGLYTTGMIKLDRDGDRAAGQEQQERARSSAEGIGTIALDSSTQARLGIVVAPLISTSQASTLDGFAKGLDAGPLAAIMAEIDSAQAAADASQAEARRLDTLYRQDVSASRRSVEAASAQARADAARVRLAEQRIGIEYGPGLMQLGVAGARQLAEEVAAGEAALVRIDIPGALLARGSVVRIGSGADGADVTVLGPASAADVKLQSAGVLAIVRGPLARQSIAARVLPASMAGGASRNGIVVPRDAVIRFQGQLWIYRVQGTNFVRVALADPVAIPQGWLVDHGLVAGERVAVHGGAGLLAIDQGSAQRSGGSEGEED